MEGASSLHHTGITSGGFNNGKTVAPAAEVEGKDSAGKTTQVSNPEYEEWFARD